MAMKFSDGFWLNQRGYEVSYASQAYRITKTKHSVKVIATPAKIFNRGMTLGGPNLEITFSSRIENVIRVSVTHFKGDCGNAPEFEICDDTGYTPAITEDSDKVEMLSGKTLLVISKNDWSVQYYYDGKKLTGGDWRALSLIKEDNFRIEKRLAMQSDDTFWAYPKYSKGTYLREQLTLSVGECIYGFGEKFTTFVKNGQTVETWNSDGGTCTEQAYKCIPFYISSRGYGVFVNSSDKVSYEIASDTVSKVSFTVNGEFLDYFIIGGANLSEVLGNYTTITGKPALPPAYTFGLWLSTSFTTSYDEETVTSFIDGMDERKIPLQIFHFDCFWMKEFELCGFEWDKSQFPDPTAMLSRLKDRGLGISVWINPYVSQHTVMFDEGMENGYFIKNKDGSIFQCDIWAPGLAIVDFTNPAACAWFAAKIRRLCEMGVNCIKTDFGERIPTDVCYYDGSDPNKMHNFYTHLYNKTVFEVLKDYYGENGACLFARSATAGGQQFPVHWGGDCYADYPSMAETLRGGLSLCLSGFGYFSHDIGGFEATATADVYKRWCAFGLLSTHSRLHGSTSYRVPWLFDEEACDVLRFYTNLKGRLMPYLYAQAVKTSLTGVPMMRAMVIDYADDPVCLYLDKQYMLGENLLIAPVMNEEGIAEFYLPAGIWTDIITGDKYDGGRYITKKCDYFQQPVLAKPNSIIPYGKFEKNFEYDYMADTCFTIYELEDGAAASCEVYSTAGEKLCLLTAVRNGNIIEVQYSQHIRSFSVAVSGTDIFICVSPTTEGKVIINL